MSESAITKSARGEECQILWRPVLGWEGLYEVSNQGEVRSVSRWVKCRYGERWINSKVLTLRIGREGYKRAYLSNGQKQSTQNVHRLVALAFVSGIGKVVRHLDGNPLNNRTENLAWGSHKDNEADKRAHGRLPMGEKHKRSVLNDSIVREIRVLHSRGHSQLAIAASLKIGRGVVGTIVRGEGWRHVT